MKKNLAELHIFGTRLDKRFSYEDLNRPIYLIHTRPLQLNFSAEDLNINDTAMHQRAKFEWRGKYDKNSEYPVFEFIGME